MSGQHTGKFWKPEEIELLKKVFKTTPTKELMPVFRCSVKVIQRMAALHGLKKDAEWLSKFRRETSTATLKAGPNRGFKKGNKPWNFGKRTTDEGEPKNGAKTDIHRPKKGSILTMYGFQEVKTVPGGRVITHRVSDVSMRAR